jgi:ribonuclease T1
MHKPHNRRYFIKFSPAWAFVLLSVLVPMWADGQAQGTGSHASTAHAAHTRSPDTLQRLQQTLDLHRRVQQALDDRANGNRRYSRDGIRFQNREGRLPNRPSNYYKEYTVQPQAGVTDRGTERLVIGQGGEVYYTPDHYVTFVRIR